MRQYCFIAEKPGVESPKSRAWRPESLYCWTLVSQTRDSMVLLMVSPQITSVVQFFLQFRSFGTVRVQRAAIDQILQLARIVLEHECLVVEILIAA